MFRTKMFIAAMLAMASIAQVVHADDPPTVGPSSPQKQVDSSEAYRRGDCVVVTGEGPRASEEEAYLIAMAPPPADDHMWYTTVFGSPKDAATQKLLQDLKSHPELAVFVVAPDQGMAWSHLNVYDVTDATQKHRIDKYKFDRIPTLVIQPPRNGMWGNPRVVVGQASYDGDPKKLAAWMRTTIKAFVKKASESGYPKDVHATVHATDPVPGGAGADPPFATPSPWTAPSVNILPQATFPFPTQEPQPPQPTTPSIPLQMPGGGTIMLIVLVALKVFELYAARTPSPVDDQIVKILKSIAGQAAAKKKNDEEEDQ